MTARHVFRPSGGIRTENVVELFRAGESVGVISEAFDLEVHEVEAALRFESA